MKKEYHKSNTKTIIRGGQIVAHNIRMFKQVLFNVLIVSIIFMIIWVLYFTFKETTSHQRYFASKYVVSYVFDFFGNTKGVATIKVQNKSFNLKHAQVVNSPLISSNANFVLETFKQEFYNSLWGTVLIFFAINFYIRRQGKKQQSDKFLRGGVVVDNSKFKKSFHSKLLKNISLGTVPILKDSETIHFEIAGSPGSGKSQSLKSLIKQIKERGDRAIIYSSSNEFISSFYDEENDIILNPLDNRSPSWSPWSEATEVYHFDDIAASLIPDVEGTTANPFWNNASRTILSNTLQKFAEDGNLSIAELFKKLLTLKQDEIATLLKNTESARLVAEDGKETTSSIMSTLATYVKAFKFLREKSDDFSIRKWVTNETEGCVFITSRKDQHETLKPLISCWVDIFATSIMSLPEDRNNRIWLIIDELPSLHRLNSLEIMLAESRKYGGCCVLGFQAYSQLEKIYGQSGARSLTSLTATKIFFRQNNQYNAHWASQELGREEIKATNESVSMGANTIRDGNSLTETDKIKELVLPTEIVNLDNLHGFYRLPGNLPVVQFKQNIFKERNNTVDGFIPSTQTDHVYMLKTHESHDEEPTDSVLETIFGTVDTTTGEVINPEFAPVDVDANKESS